MISRWIEELCVRWLTRRGFFVLRAHVPYIIITGGVGTVRKMHDDAMEYQVLMPKGHRLWALENTTLVLVEDEDK